MKHLRRRSLLAFLLIPALAIGTAVACNDGTTTSGSEDAGSVVPSDGAAIDAGPRPDGSADSGADGPWDAASVCPPLKGTSVAATTCSKTFGNGIDRLLPSSIATDRDGNVVITGSFYGTVDFGGGPLTSAGDAEGFLVKLDAQCNHLWSRRFGSSDIEGGVALAIADDGRIVLGVSAREAIDLGRGSLAANLDKKEDVVVGLFDPCGNAIWTKRFGGVGAQSLRTVAVDSSGKSIILAGSFVGNIDFGGGPLSGGSAGQHAFVAKLDGNGSHLWSKSFGSPLTRARTTFAESVALADDGSLTAAGVAQLTVDFGTGPIDFPAPTDGFGMWLVRFDPLGSVTTARAVNDASGGIVRSSGGALFSVGTLSALVDLGTGPLAADGGSFHTSFLTRLNPADLSTTWVVPFGSDSPNLRLTGMRFAARAGDIGLSAFCVGAVDLGGPQPCADGQHIFLRYDNNGAFGSVIQFPRGPVAVAPPGQYVVAGAKGDTPGAAERMTVAKLPP